MQLVLTSQPDQVSSQKVPAKPVASAGKLNALTGLRFVAAIYVVVYHFGFGASKDFPVVANSLYGAATTLPFFFALSGFVLGYSYSKRKPTVRRFYAARLARICPLYFLALLLTLPHFLVESLQKGPSVISSLASFVTTPLLLQAWLPQTALRWNFPGWSISVEALFYLLFPFCLSWFASRSMRATFGLLLGCWLLCVAPASLYCLMNPDHVQNLAVFAYPTYIIPEQSGWLGFLIHNPVFHLPEFFAGIALSRLFQLRSVKFEFLWKPILWLSLAGLTFTLYHSGGIDYPLLHNGVVLPFLLTLLFCLSATSTLPSKVLSCRFLVQLGEASYAIYILQYPVLLILKAVVYLITGIKLSGYYLPNPAAVAGYLLLLCAISLGATKWIENHLHGRVDLLFNRWLTSRANTFEVDRLRRLNVT
jgi:peptidoglycan/LPS O-acetylase OafA/YrhL